MFKDNIFFFRPWYVETATSIPKDIVILIDRTKSMVDTGAFFIAKDAAEIVISTLNPRDRVNCREKI